MNLKNLMICIDVRFRLKFATGKLSYHPMNPTNPNSDKKKWLLVATQFLPFNVF